MFTALSLVVIWAASLQNHGRVPIASHWLAFPKFPLLHLWFLYVLLEFYAAALVLRAGVNWLDATGRIRSGVDRLVSLVMRHPLGLVIPAVPVAIAFTFDST